VVAIFVSDKYSTSFIFNSAVAGLIASLHNLFSDWGVVSLLTVMVMGDRSFFVERLLDAA